MALEHGLLRLPALGDVLQRAEPAHRPPVGATGDFARAPHVADLTGRRTHDAIFDVVGLQAGQRAFSGLAHVGHVVWVEPRAPRGLGGSEVGPSVGLGRDAEDLERLG